MLKILGYPNRYSVAPGEPISFHVSLEEGNAYDARIVRVVNGDCNPAGPGLDLPHVPSAVDGRYSGVVRRVDAGSYLLAPDVPPLAPRREFSFRTWIWPTLRSRPSQVLVAQWDAATQSGFRLTVNERGLALVVGDGTGRTACVDLAVTMLERKWYFVSLSLDLARQRVRLDQTALQTDYGITDSGSHEAALPMTVGGTSGGLYLAGAPQADGTIGEHFNGKIEDPVFVEGEQDPSSLATTLVRSQVAASSRDIIAGWNFADAIEAVLDGAHDPAVLAAPTLPEAQSADIIAAWDFADGMRTTQATDVGPSRRHGQLVNLPARGMKGATWTGEHHSWQAAPAHYAAVHFHEDDLYDAGWPADVVWSVPQDARSGAYALHLRCGDSDPEAMRESYIPFFIRPSRTAASRPKVAVLAPVCSYMAYANHAGHIMTRGVETLMGRLLDFGHQDVYLYDHPEICHSLYDKHADGSGVCYSSRLRPVINYAPRYHSWLGGDGSSLYQYNADTHLFGWLAHHDIEYDIITDEDLHYDGYELIKDYRVILTGSHPEYHSTAMWDAMKAWLDRGGRLMYLGGNGWYWRIAFHDELPGVIEVRRAEDGIRSWEAEPGEYYQSFNGEYGGLWRRCGRPPNMMTGIGFIAQGFDVSSYYRRAPDADNPRASFIFAGVSDEIIGDFGLVGGGAAGIELDCINPLPRLIREPQPADAAGERRVHLDPAQPGRRSE